MQVEQEVGYAKPPRAGRFRKGQTGNPDGRSREYHPPFDPGIILQNIESETIAVLTKGKRKHISRIELNFRNLFNKAAGGDMEAAKSVVAMARRYFAPEPEDDFESQRGPLFIAKKQFANWQRKQKRRGAPQPVSPFLLFRRVAQERVTIKGYKGKRTIFEGVLRQISTMALNNDPIASKLIEVARKHFPGIRNPTAPLVFIVNEEDLRL
jgi:hypothetical protein